MKIRTRIRDAVMVEVVMIDTSEQRFYQTLYITAHGLISPESSMTIFFDVVPEWEP